jgi:hypothetical protein
MTETETLWTERVAAWRASGLSAPKFAEAYDFTAGTLRWWASRLSKGTAKPVVLARVEVRANREESSGVRIEVGGVRIVVAHGFDADVLRAVVGALHGAGPR